MNIEEYRDYCVGLKGAEECFPFGGDTLVYKVRGLPNSWSIIQA